MANAYSRGDPLRSLGGRFSVSAFERELSLFIVPPYDVSDITALLGGRVIMDVLATLVEEGKLGGVR